MFLYDNETIIAKKTNNNTRNKRKTSRMFVSIEKLGNLGIKVRILVAI